MHTGVNLSLYVGPVPIPAPRIAIESLSSVRVEAGSGQTQAGFELTFDLPAGSPLRTLFLLTGGGSLPLMRVVLVAHFGGSSEPIIDGVTTNVETIPGQGGVSKLVVKGKDLTALMDIIDVPGFPFPAMPPAVRVLVVLAKYAALGVIPIVIPSFVEDLPIPVERIPVQKGTDYAYVTALAEQCGHVFYMEPGPAPGTSRAYWGPEIRVGMPQPALNVNMDALTNVEELTFNFDKERKTIPIVYIQEPMSKSPIPVPIPDVTPLNPPLGAVPPVPPKIQQLDDTAQMSPVAALMRGVAYTSKNSDSVFGSGRLDVARYGRILKSRQLVGVRGAGPPFNGLYYVQSVTHEIRRGAYRQSFTLARNGLVSTIPAVPV